MKKVYLSALVAAFTIGTTFAQESAGGLPLSSKVVYAKAQEVAALNLKTPDFDAIIRENNEKEEKGITGPYMVSTFINSDIGLHNTGTWTYLEDGRKIWRLTVSVPESKGIGFYYDRFSLPFGVELYISNEDGRQVLGAYTADNNNEYQNFTNEPIFGSVAHIEMNIAPEVAIRDIIFHINEVAAYYRGVEYLEELYGQSATGSVAAKPNEGQSAPCHINANEDLPSYAPMKAYQIQKNASVQITIKGSGAGGFCSGTLVNSAGNSQDGECVPYLLTASHCDGPNSFDDAHFSQWAFRFKYRYDKGTTTLPDKQGTNTTAVGADFRARSFYPSMSHNANDNPPCVSDFLLLKLKQPLNRNWDAYLVGWNRATDLTTEQNRERYDFFIGFHHPKGDVQKQSYATAIEPDGVFNQTTVRGTHWDISFLRGGTQPGSSGSGLFDVDGLIIGDLSGGTNKGCQGGHPDYGSNSKYSKISYAWENEYDNSNHPRPAGKENQTRLKDWLDPNNTGAIKWGHVSAECKPASIQSKKTIGKDIEVYPNPSKDGIIKAQFNFTENTNLEVHVYNSLGRLVKSFSITNSGNGHYTFDCSDLANGIYVMKFTDGVSVASKKVLINQ